MGFLLYLEAVLLKTIPYAEFKIKTITMIDGDKKDKYSHIPDVLFTKGRDFEEDIYDNFTLTDYMKYNNWIGKLGAFVNILRPYGITLNVPNYRSNPDLFIIDPELQKQIIVDIKSSGLTVLRDSKNASKDSLKTLI